MGRLAVLLGSVHIELVLGGGVADRAYEDEKPFAFTGTVKKVLFDIATHPAAQDDLDVHTAEQHGQAAHALSE